MPDATALASPRAQTELQELVSRFDGPAYVVRPGDDLRIEAWNVPAEQEFLWGVDEVLDRPAYEVLRPTIGRSTREERTAALLLLGWWTGHTVLSDRHRVARDFDGACWRVWTGGEELRYLTVLEPLKPDVIPGLIEETHFIQIAGSECHLSAPEVPLLGTVPDLGTTNNGRHVQLSGTMDAQPMSRKELCGANLKLRREKAGLTQGEVGAYLGLKGHEHVCHWEAGREPRDATLQKLARLYKCEVSDFYAPLNNGDKAAATC